MITAYLTIDLKPPLSFMLLPCTSQLKQNLLPRFVLLGRCPWQEGWAPEKIFVMQACIAAFSLQFALPLQTYFPTHSGNRKKTHQNLLCPNTHLSQAANPGATAHPFQWISVNSEYFRNNLINFWLHFFTMEKVLLFLETHFLFNRSATLKKQSVPWFFCFIFFMSPWIKPIRSLN